MTDLRQSILMDTDMLASKQRFALFSQPPSIAIGDDSPYRQKLPRKGPDGKPLTQPRNILPGANRSGVDRKSFIQSTSSIYVGDQYVDQEKVNRQYYNKLHSRASFQERDFIPSSGISSQADYPYKHVDENPFPKVKPKRDETGRVVSNERNLTTNPMSKVDGELFKGYRHMLDPYQRKSQIQCQQRKLAKQKMLPELFRSMSHGDILFVSDKKTYGVDPRTEELLKKKRHSLVMSELVKVPHETAFKPARRGHGDPIGRFPEFIMPNPEEMQRMQKSTEKVKPKDSEDQQQRWKHNGNKTLTRPTPSISYSAMNLRKYL